MTTTPHDTPDDAARGGASTDESTASPDRFRHVPSWATSTERTGSWPFDGSLPGLPDAGARLVHRRVLLDDDQLTLTLEQAVRPRHESAPELRLTLTDDVLDGGSDDDADAYRVPLEQAETTIRRALVVERLGLALVSAAHDLAAAQWERRERLGLTHLAPHPATTLSTKPPARTGGIEDVLAAPVDERDEYVSADVRAEADQIVADLRAELIGVHALVRRRALPIAQERTEMLTAALALLSGAAKYWTGTWTEHPPPRVGRATTAQRAVAVAVAEARQVVDDLIDHERPQP
jgi:hypothetical protein